MIRSRVGMPVVCSPQERSSQWYLLGVPMISRSPRSVPIEVTEEAGKRSLHYTTRPKQERDGKDTQAVGIPIDSDITYGGNHVVSTKVHMSGGQVGVSTATLMAASPSPCKMRMNGFGFRHSMETSAFSSSHMERRRRKGELNFCSVPEKIRVLSRCAGSGLVRLKYTSQARSTQAAIRMFKKRREENKIK